MQIVLFPPTGKFKDGHAEPGRHAILVRSRKLLYLLADSSYSGVFAPSFNGPCRIFGLSEKLSQARNFFVWRSSRCGHIAAHFRELIFR
jgi:hypothetical protein